MCRLADSDNGKTNTMNMATSDQAQYPTLHPKPFVSERTIKDHHNHLNVLLSVALCVASTKQGAYNLYTVVKAFWDDTTAKDNIRGADITASTVAGSTETISSEVTPARLSPDRMVRVYLKRVTKGVYRRLRAVVGHDLPSCIFVCVCVRTYAP